MARRLISRCVFDDAERQKSLEKILDHPDNGALLKTWEKWLSLGVPERELANLLLDITSLSGLELPARKPLSGKQAKRHAIHLRKDAEKIQQLLIQFSDALSLGPRGGTWVQCKWPHASYMRLPELLRQFAEDVLTINFLEHQERPSESRLFFELEVVNLRLVAARDKCISRIPRLYEAAATLINGAYHAAGIQRELDAENWAKTASRSSLKGQFPKPSEEKPPEVW